MSNKPGIAGVAALLVVVIAAGVFFYNRLATDQNPEDSLVMMGDTSASAATVAESVSAAESASAVESAASSSSEASEPEPASEPEKIEAIDFTVYDGDGNAVKLSDKFGKPIVLNFWASWCPPCKSEMPDFNKVYEELGDDVTFMMVDIIGGSETKESGAAYIAQQGFTFPVYYDLDMEAAIAYSVTSIPATLFIDAEGYITVGSRGAINEEILRMGIDIIYTP